MNLLVWRQHIRGDSTYGDAVYTGMQYIRGDITYGKQVAWHDRGKSDIIEKGDHLIVYE